MRIVGRDSLADLFGVVPKTISDWSNEGMPYLIQGGPGIVGEYDSAACVRWLVERELRKVQGENPKDRLARLQGDELEMKLAQQRGRLVEAAAVEPAMRAAIVAARERVRNAPARLSAQLEGLGRTEREAALRELLDDVLTKLSRWSAEDLEHEDGGADEFAG